MDKISIIIPIYNVEPYIRKCLDSVINQTYVNLEILLINDGSPDDCGAICDEYADKDSRIRVFHKENGGVSSAKNVGLKNATGKYIGFVDSDDWIELDMYENLYNAIKNGNVQISVCNYFKATDTEIISVSNSNSIGKIISTKDMVLYPLKRDDYLGFCGYLWNKLFSASLFAETGLNFEKGINYGEDVLLYTKLILHSKCEGVYVNKPLYYYYQRENSIAGSKSVKVKADILAVYKKVEELLNASDYAGESYWARGFYCYHASVICELAIRKRDNEMLSKMQNEIREHYDDYKRTNEKFPEKFKRIDDLLAQTTLT